MRKVHVEIIEWYDPYSVDEWTDLSSFNTKINMVVTIGQVLDETQKQVIIALNYVPEEDNASCIMVINKDTIKSRRKIDAQAKQKKRR